MVQVFYIRYGSDDKNDNSYHVKSFLYHLLVKDFVLPAFFQIATIEIVLC